MPHALPVLLVTCSLPIAFHLSCALKTYARSDGGEGVGGNAAPLCCMFARTYAAYRHTAYMAQVHGQVTSI